MDTDGNEFERRQTLYFTKQFEPLQQTMHSPTYNHSPSNNNYRDSLERSSCWSFCMSLRLAASSTAPASPTLLSIARAQANKAVILSYMVFNNQAVHCRLYSERSKIIIRWDLHDRALSDTHQFKTSFLTLLFPPATLHTSIGRAITIIDTH